MRRTRKHTRMGSGICGRDHQREKNQTCNLVEGKDHRANDNQRRQEIKDNTVGPCSKREKENRS
jgi:hypothetical protein